MDAISRLLRPRSVAVIGASADPTRTAGRPVAYLQKHGFAGTIHPVNPRVERIGELKCYSDVASLPEVPDVGIALLGPNAIGLVNLTDAIVLSARGPIASWCRRWLLAQGQGVRAADGGGAGVIGLARSPL